MIVLISCAKIMTGTQPTDFPLKSEPFFQQQANNNAIQMASYSASELKSMLKVNNAIAQENKERFQCFFDTDKQRIPAVFAYDGMVFKKLAPETFSLADADYANKHLFICSFLYGLLRPFDLVMKYRLEGNVRLPQNEGQSMFDYWKPLLTKYLTDYVKADGGILVNLASDEMRGLFDWKKVTKEINVITPQFLVERNGKRKNIVIYTKMCRGLMTRFIIKNRINKPEQLKDFSFEGYASDVQSDDYTFVDAQ